jgi:hypothetical protein
MNVFTEQRYAVNPDESSKPGPRNRSFRMAGGSVALTFHAGEIGFHLNDATTSLKLYKSKIWQAYDATLTGSLSHCS